MALGCVGFCVTLGVICTLTSGARGAISLDQLTEQLVGHLRNGFYEIRHHRTNEAGLRRAQTYIHDYWTRLHASAPRASILHVQTFTASPTFNFTKPVNGTNYIYILPSDNWGNSNDTVIVVGANYDTSSESAGVDDNGSGMSALLEMSNLLTTSISTCIPSMSIIFVAFSNLGGEGRPSGAEVFMRRFLMPKHLDEGLASSNYVGTVILKGLLNYDNTTSSQIVPNLVALFLGETSKTLQENDYRGDFVTLLSVTSDNVTSGGIETEWTRREVQARKFKAINVVANLNVQMMQMYKEFIPKKFFSPELLLFTFGEENASFSFKPTLITDTLSLRGYMSKCASRRCDNLKNALKDDNILFFTTIVDTTARYLARIRGCPLEPAFRRSAVTNNMSSFYMEVQIIILTHITVFVL